MRLVRGYVGAGLIRLLPCSYINSRIRNVRTTTDYIKTTTMLLNICRIGEHEMFGDEIVAVDL